MDVLGEHAALMTDRADVVLHLDEPGELFDVPPVNPFHPHGRTVTGIDEVVDHLRTRRLRRVPRSTVTLVLPDEHLTDDVATRVRLAVDQHCTAMIARARLRKQIIRYDATSKLGSELLVIPIVALALALVLALVPALPAGVVAVFTPVLTITIWVAIWNPVDSLLFDRWSENRTIEVYTFVQDMEFSVRPRPPIGDSHRPAPTSTDGGAA